MTDVGAASGARAPRLAATLSLPVVSWALYDFANTIFSYAVVTRYFNEWIVIERGEPDYYVGLMSFAVSVVLVVSLPFFGAAADRSGRRKPFLVAFTLVSVAATALLGAAGSTLAALLLGGVAIFAFSSALAHYDPLLANVAPPEARGRVSGLGVGLGYVGVLVALAVLGALVPAGENQRAFVPTALLFLVFALPCFLFVRDMPVPAERRVPLRPLALAGAALAQLAATIGRARAHAHVGRFLLARFLYADALATVIVFMTVYARRVGELPAGRITALLGVSLVFAAVGSVAAGLLVERVGPKRVLLVILAALAVTLAVAAVSGSAAFLWIAGPVVGISLGGVWTSDRVFMLRLAPAALRGELFGLYTLVGKVSSGVGPLVLWGGTIWLLTQVTGAAGTAAATRAAVLALAASAVVGGLLLLPLSDAERSEAPRA